MNLTLLAALLLTSSATPRLILHEWGTFTSIAGKDGFELEWAPLSGESDLPAFVHTEQTPGPTRFVGRPSRGKGESGTLRMETPVIYFYADRPMEIALSVAFPSGRITEWYPHARTVFNSAEVGLIDWGRLKIIPRADGVQLPHDGTQSHYYPARDTDAAIVQACGDSATEVDKFLFYRGVGTAELPLIAKLQGRSVSLAFREARPPTNAIIYERQGDKAGFTIATVGTNALRPELDTSPNAVMAPLRELLLAEGLYPKEADAMLQTWKDSWFEDGLRVFYVLPSSDTARLLPLTVSPAPTETVRVMVGRTELFTPETLAEAKKLSESQAESKFGRFAQAMRQYAQ